MFKTCLEERPLTQLGTHVCHCMFESECDAPRFLPQTCSAWPPFRRSVETQQGIPRWIHHERVCVCGGGGGGGGGDEAFNTHKSDKNKKNTKYLPVKKR